MSGFRAAQRAEGLAAGRSRFDATMSENDAALDIALGDLSAWGDAERIAAVVSALNLDPEMNVAGPLLRIWLRAKLDIRAPEFAQ